MKKEKSLFDINGVSFRQYEKRMTVEEIRNILSQFRKENRPSYYLINALLKIRSLQNDKKTLEDQNARLRGEVRQATEYHVIRWVLLIIGLIVFGI